MPADLSENWRRIEQATTVSLTGSDDSESGYIVKLEDSAVANHLFTNGPEIQD